MTGWSDALGLSVPIVCAPMGGVAGGDLATAVSSAGALGMIGMGSSGTAARLERELALVPEGTPIGIGMVDWVRRRDERLLAVALEARPVLLSVSFGDPSRLDWVLDAQAAGVCTVVQVATVDEARQAATSGVDVVVARGLEGGGHGRPLTERDTLLTRVLDAVDVPVLAAGAIGTAEDVAAVLEQGAAAVWVGTAFAACPESLSTPGMRSALLAADNGRTHLTSAFDRAAGHDWPDDLPERVIVNEFTDRWPSAAAVDQDPEAARFLRSAEQADDPNGICVNAGQAVGSLTEVAPAAAVVRSLCPTPRSTSQDS